MKKSVGASGQVADELPPSSRTAMPSNTNRSLTIALLRAREALMVHFRPMLARHDLTEQQWRVLRVAAEVDDADASQIAERSCILAPSLTRILRTLEERGLVARDRDAADGRRQIVSVTKKGHAVMRVVAPESAAVYRSLESEFGREWVDDLLERLRLLGLFEGDGDSEGSDRRLRGKASVDSEIGEPAED